MKSPNLLLGWFRGHTPLTLLFSEKGRTEKSFAFNEIDGRQISLIYLNEILNMVDHLKNLVCTYEYRH